MANKFVIEVKAKGFTNLEQQLNRADNATKGYEKSTQKLRGTTTGLRRQIGALRNNILLYTFAVAGATKAVGALVGASSKFEAVRTRLVGLTGSVNAAEKAFNNFNQVAATTPFSLEDVVGAGAQLQAFGADANALIKPITDLAAFMGTTAVEAANSFGRAFAGGAGAADILRERGILNIIKSSQGIADLSKTTLPEFREALIRSIQDPVVGIVGSTDRMSKTFDGASSNMKDSFTRMAAATGDLIIKSFKLKERMVEVGDSISEVAKKINFMNDPIKNLTARLQALGLEAENLESIAQVLAAEDTRAAIKEEDQLITNLAQTLRDLPEIAPLFERNLGALEDFMSFGGSDDTFAFTSNFDTLGEKVLSSRDRLEEFIATGKNLSEIEAATTQIEKLNKLIDLLQIGAKETQEVFPEMLGDMQVFDIFADIQNDLDNDQAKSTEKYKQGIKERIDSFKEFVDFQIDNTAFYNEALAESDRKMVSSDELRRDRIKLRTDDMRREGEAIHKNAAAFRGFSDNMSRAVMEGQNLGDAVVNSLEAIAAKIASEAISFLILNMITGGGFSAGQAGFSALASLQKKHKGGPISANGIQAFNAGGQVQGRDNVPILAQAGEYIIKKDSAQAIGLDKLNEINDTGQTGSLTVNVSAPLVDETVIDSIIPAIQKASRFNLA